MFDAWDICVVLKMGLTSYLQMKHCEPLIRRNCASASNSTHTHTHTHTHAHTRTHAHAHTHTHTHTHSLSLSLSLCITLTLTYEYKRYMGINSTVSTRNLVTTERTELWCQYYVIAGCVCPSQLQGHFVHRWSRTVSPSDYQMSL
jgi:ABC-type nickel/cobalt efflux system permease component RcnA